MPDVATSSEARGPVPAVEATASVDLTATLDLLAQTIVQALGFGVAVVNLARPDGSQAVVSVAGSAEAREALHGHVDSADVWARLLAASEPWGRLCFLDHRDDSVDAMGVYSWIPDIEVPSDPEAWHPEDALFAPLYASDGSLLGILSVDLPRDGRRPDLGTRNALEAFAVSAALAIEHATLRSRAEESEQRFAKLASSDPLTGLGNRSLLLDRLQHACKRRSRLAMALVFVDLDGFKQVNDTLGHPVGDQLLRQVADALQHAVRDQDTVVRQGGDEFCVLAPETDAEEAAALVERIRGALGEVIANGLPLSASLGFATFPADATSAELLLAQADHEQRLDKAASRGGRGGLRAVR